MPPRHRNLKRAVALLLCALLLGCNGKQDKNRVAVDAAGGDAPVLAVPIQRVGHWIAEVHGADNKGYHVVLDTGATINMLAGQGPLAASAFTAEAEARYLRQGLLRKPASNGAIAAESISEWTQSKLGLSPALRIQGWSMPAGALAVLIHPEALASIAHARFDGVIGNESMRNLTWRADYVAGRLTAYANEAPAHDWQQCTFMTLNTATQLPVIVLTHDGQDAEFIVDTGYDAEIQLPEEWFDSLARAKQFEQFGTDTFYDVKGHGHSNHVGVLDGLTIGQMKLPKLVVSRSAVTPRIGLGVLQKMDRFELDYRHYRFCFDLPQKPANSELVTAGAEHQATRRSVKDAPDAAE